jgi:magnesium chelatase subunit D
MNEGGATQDDQRWLDAGLAASLIAIDPLGCGGASLRSPPGPARDTWLARLRDVIPAGIPMRKIPTGIGDERLLGGLDLAATLSAGRPVSMRGLLAECDGGVLIAAMAERMSGETAARLASALDRRSIRPERTGAAEEMPTRLGLILLDEGIEAEEGVPSALFDRLAFVIDFTDYRGPLDDPGFPDGEAIQAAQARLRTVETGDDAIEMLVHTATVLGVASLRAAVLALNAARAAAALSDHDHVTVDDCALAARLVLAPRATQIPADPETAEDDPPPEPPDSSDDQETPPDNPDGQQTPEDIVVAAAKAALPRDLLAKLKAGRITRAPAEAGRRGQAMRSMARGRPVGVRPGLPKPGQRLDVVETLRAAAPWQPLRRRERAESLEEDTSQRIAVRRDDFRLKRFKRARDTCTIFVVDASGSSALNRLAEAKGAVELLLAECYSRRDQVALITFAGTLVDLALPPTRSLVRAKRMLAGLPGGGGTPLAAAIDAAGDLADALARRGRTPAIVMMTDGRGNIARDGVGAPARAAEEALSAARLFAAKGHAALLVDIAPRPRDAAAAISTAMAAQYLALPRADARALSTAVRGATGR